jgi:uncharacterized membrane protein YccC
MINFMKNVCMAGGFLQLFAWGAGTWSVLTCGDITGRSGSRGETGNESMMASPA